MDSISIQIPSLTENIRIIESFIDNAKEKYQLNDDIYGNIMIAVTESVNNAIVHGNKSVADKNVYLSLELQDSAIKFIIEDEGSGFEYDKLPDPTSPDNVDKPSGRGIFLIKHLSDEMEFKDLGRKLELTFYMA